MSEKITAYDFSEFGIAYSAAKPVQHGRRSCSSYAYVHGSGLWYGIEPHEKHWRPATRERLHFAIVYRCQHLARRLERDAGLTDRPGYTDILRLASMATVDAVERAIMLLSGYSTEAELAATSRHPVERSSGMLVEPCAIDDDEDALADV